MAVTHRARAWLMARWHGDERLRFLLIGGWNTLFGYLAFLLFYLLLHAHLHYLVIAAVAYAVATINAFACHRVLTFKSQGPIVGEFLRFTFTQAFALGFNIVGLWALVEFVHLDPLLSQAVVSVLAVVMTYVVHRRFTFVA